MFHRPKPRFLLLLTVLSSFAVAGCSPEADLGGPLGPVGTLGPSATTAPLEPELQGGYALNFSGLHGRVTVPYSPEYKSSRFTVELWVRLSSRTSKFTPLIASTNTNEWNTADGFSVKFEGNRTYLRAAKAPNLAAGYFTDYAPALHRWTHVAGTFDGAVGRLYVDGELVNETPDAQPVWYGTRGLLFGQGSHSLYGGVVSIHGLMDEIRIWDRARTGEEIRADMRRILSGSESGLVGYWNFNEGGYRQARDISPSRNHGLLSGGVTYIPASPF